jgi:hypothetical protein
MITRPCRISLQTARIPSRSLPNTSLGDELYHRHGNFSPLQHRCTSPDIQNVNNRAYASADVKVKQRLSPAKPGNPSLRLIGRLLLINNTNTNFSSKTPSPSRVQHYHSPLAYLRRFFRLQSKLQLSYPQFFLSHSKSPRGTRISSSNDNLPARSRGGAASQTPISRAFGVGKTAMHIWYSPHISRADQSSILHDAAYRGSHDLLAVFLPIREISHNYWNHTKKCAVHCDSATIAQWCLERA